VPPVIFSRVDEHGHRLVMDAHIRRNAVERRSLGVCGENRCDQCGRLRGRTRIDQSLRKWGVIAPRILTLG
jgi:hypothetical protein